MRTIVRRPIALSLFLLALFLVMLPARPVAHTSAASSLVITEVAPWSSGNSPFMADWFEVTNFGSTAVNVSAWMMDDNSNSFSFAVPLTGISSIAPGESVIFIETPTLATTAAAFKSVWFGANPPPNLQIGAYNGNGVGLSTGGDAVNLYDTGGTLQASVTFGAASAGPVFASFDNTAANAAVSQLSVAGTNGAFVAATDTTEVGSPGVVGKLFISEVAPWASSVAPLSSDWFEVTNTTAAAINVSTWKMDDNSNSFANAVPLAGIASIAPVESVIFIEVPAPTTPQSIATTIANFKSVWFGANPPAALQIGIYSGAGVGLSTGGDAVNLFNSTGVLQANVSFGNAPTNAPFASFDNAAGLNTAISLLSVVGINGAFKAASDANQTGSPGTTITKGTPPAPPPTNVKINEVESNGGSPADWVELTNTGTTAVDVSGLKFLDSDNTHTKYTIPAGTSIAAGGFLVLDQAQFGFELDSRDTAQLLAADGVTVVDTFSWLEHSSTTYGRCLNGAGTLAFITTLAPTKGTANACPTYAPWPGGTDIQTADGANVFGGNLSGLIYDSSGSATPGVMWGVRNGSSTIPSLPAGDALYRLIFSGGIWTPDPTNNWSVGKKLFYPNGQGDPDSEGVTFTGAGPAGGIYVSTERDNNVSGTSRPAVLRFDPSAPGATLTATNDWNLTADLPPLGANLGLEGITWVPDTFLTSRGFFDEAKSRAYNPADYPNHGTGLFFVGVENNGFVYAYALDQTSNAFARIATIDSGFPAVMELQFDRELNNFWAVCDDTCQGRTAILQIDPASGHFMISQRFERPAGMPNFNNEGFAMASEAECVNHLKPVYWADDTEDGGHAIRRGTLNCVGAAGFGSPATTTFMVGNPGTFTVTAASNTPATFSEQGPLPAGVSFNPQTGVLSGVPGIGTQGTYVITFTATNGSGAPSAQTFTLIVTCGAVSKGCLPVPTVTVAPAAISEHFNFMGKGGPVVQVGQSVALQFSILNPNGTALTGVGFTNPLPAGLVVGTTGVSGNCGGVAVTAAPGGSTISLAGATLAANASCSFTVSVTATSQGLKTSTSTPVSSVEGGPGNVASDSITAF